MAKTAAKGLDGGKLNAANGSAFNLEFVNRMI